LDALTELVFVIPEGRLTDSITGIFCCKNFCRQYDMFRETLFTFQQDSAPAHHARDTIKLLLELHRSTSDFIADCVSWAPGARRDYAPSGV